MESYEHKIQNCLRKLRKTSDVVIIRRKESMWALHAGFLVSRAREFCAAAQLGLRTAMRPFGSLSGGEQTRAQVARLLDEGVQRSRLDVQSIARGFIEGFVR